MPRLWVWALFLCVSLALRRKSEFLKAPKYGPMLSCKSNKIIIWFDLTFIVTRFTAYNNGLDKWCHDSVNKKLRRCRDSATCEPFDAILRAEFGITGYYDPNLLSHAGSQGIELSRHMPMSTSCYSAWSQSTNVTDRQTDKRTSLLVAKARHVYIACRAKESKKIITTDKLLLITCVVMCQCS